MSKLIVGCGYLGSRVARLWLKNSEQVYAMTRSQDRAAQLTQQGLSPIVADVTDPSSLQKLPRVDTVLYAVGYDRAAGKPMRQVYVDGLKQVLDALPPGIGRFIYISSTGVYGSADGDWINEDTPCHPVREGGEVSLDAERVLNQHPLGSRTIILRLAGIYGPGRIPNAAALKAGEPILAPSSGFLNLIHVDDAAALVLAAEQLKDLPRLYVVSDGHPVQRRDYYEELARLLDAPAPKFGTPVADSPAAARASADKRIDNRRMLADLAIALKYPSFREGLANIVAARP